MEAPASQRLTARDTLLLGSQRLERAGVASARLDMSLMLARVLGADRLGLYVDLDRTLTDAERQAARELLARRLRREPLAYLLGEREFCGLAFQVDRRVLIPRPETEHLVDAVAGWLQAQRPARPTPLMADIGTGSGAIAVAVAHRCPWSRWIATDADAGALEVARANAGRHDVAERVEFREGSLLEPIRETLDGICSNPPYVAEGDLAALEPEVRDWEPRAALASGGDGLDHLRTLIAGAAGRLAPGGWLGLECGRGQAAAVRELIEATGAFEAVTTIRDLAGIERVVTATRRPVASAWAISQPL